MVTGWAVTNTNLADIHIDATNRSQTGYTNVNPTARCRPSTTGGTTGTNERFLAAPPLTTHSHSGRGPRHRHLESCPAPAHSGRRHLYFLHPLVPEHLRHHPDPGTRSRPPIPNATHDTTPLEISGTACQRKLEHTPQWNLCSQNWLYHLSHTRTSEPRKITSPVTATLSSPTPCTWTEAHGRAPRRHRGTSGGATLNGGIHPRPRWHDGYHDAAGVRDVWKIRTGGGEGNVVTGARQSRKSCG